MKPDKNPTAACGGWEIPGGFAAYTAGTVDGNSRRLCGMYHRGPGRYSDRQSAGRLPSSDSPQYQPIVRLRSSAVRRCDGHHEMVNYRAVVERAGVHYRPVTVNPRDTRIPTTPRPSLPGLSFTLYMYRRVPSQAASAALVQLVTTRPARPRCGKPQPVASHRRVGALTRSALPTESRTPAPSRRTSMRKPSCLIWCSQPAPAGGLACWWTSPRTMRASEGIARSADSLSPPPLAGQGNVTTGAVCRERRAGCAQGATQGYAFKYSKSCGLLSFDGSW
jgi:hypothetical protein